MARSNKAAKPRGSDTGAWEQAETHAGGFREIEALSGYRFPLQHDSIEALKARGFASEEIYSIVAPRRTLARRKEQNENLSIAESDRVVRLNRISDMADRVFGDHEKALRWLRKKSRVLNEAPMAFVGRDRKRLDLRWPADLDDKRPAENLVGLHTKHFQEGAIDEGQPPVIVTPNDRIVLRVEKRPIASLVFAQHPLHILQLLQPTLDALDDLGARQCMRT